MGGARKSSNKGPSLDGSLGSLMSELPSGERATREVRNEQQVFLCTDLT